MRITITKMMDQTFPVMPGMGCSNSHLHICCCQYCKQSVLQSISISVLQSINLPAVEKCTSVKRRRETRKGWGDISTPITSSSLTANFLTTPFLSLFPASNQICLSLCVLDLFVIQFSFSAETIIGERKRWTESSQPLWEALLWMDSLLLLFCLD